EDVNILYFPHQLKGSILIGKPSDDKWRRGGHVTSAQSGSRRAHRNLAGDGPHGLLCKSTPSMDQTHPDKAALATPAEPGPRPPASSRSGLWRALAGMAVALEIAATIVAIDLSHELVSRVSNYRSRIASLNKRVDRLKRQAVADEKRLADAREEIKERKLMQSRDRMKAILVAPDRRTI